MQTLRRAEHRDLPSIIQLIRKDAASGKDDLEKTLKKRFGEDLDIGELVDVSPFSVVAADKDDTQVYGFLALSNGPPASVDQSATFKGDVDVGATSRGDWPTWLKRWYDYPDVQTNNTKFLSFFVADPDYSLAFLDEALTTTFTLLPQLEYICYLLPEQLVLFPPLSSSRYQLPVGGDGNDATRKPVARRRAGRGKKKAMRYFSEASAVSSSAAFALHVCARRDLMPQLRIRNARVEDADDLVPMFKRQNLIKGKHADFYLADLLESKSGNVKTLVAEADGEVVGFMSLNRNVQQQALVETFQLESFDFLMRDVPERVTRKVNSRFATVPEQHSDATQRDDNMISARSPSRSDADGSEFGSSQDDVARDSRPTSARSEQGFSLSNTLSATTHESKANVPLDSPAIHTPKPTTPQQPNIETALPNAFCISLFFMEEPYSRQAIEFVKTSFTHLFPELDYCVVTVPSNVREMPLLKHFAYVPPKVGMTSSNCLYVINRFGIDEHVVVHHGTIDDLDTADEFLEDVADRDEIFARFEKSVHATASMPAPFYAFTITHASQVVGIIILETCQTWKLWRDQFALHDFMNPRLHKLDGRPILLRHFIINPLFEHQARWVFEELMRITGTSCLLYPVKDQHARDPATRRIAIRELAPVRPRKEIQFPNSIRDGEVVPSPLPCSLQMITTSLLYEPKIAVNTRIVVIGGSDTGIAFLERLAYSSHLWFTNLILISTGSMLTVDNETEASPYVSHGCYSNVELQQLGLPHYVQVMRGSADEIDRISKRVRISNGSYVNYDYLILTPGLQQFVEALNEELATIEGVYALSRDNASVIDEAIDKATKDRTGSKIIVYGRDLQAYSGVQLLLERGISPQRIVLVVPPLRLPASCFNNTAVEEKVHRLLKELGIQLHRGWTLSRWEENHGMLFAVHLKSKAHDGHISITNATIFLYADEKSVSADTFKAINDSSLVFDGRLVIDKYYRTQDPFIYAAGSITKYSSKYQTRWAHAFYDAREVGGKLADLLLPAFDPTCLPVCLVEDEHILRFEDAKKVLTILPGNIVLFHFDCPRLPSHTHTYRKELADYGRDLVIDTFDSARADGSYFRIHVDGIGYIRSITYLGSKRIPVNNILRLYGMHERYLNRLVARFDEGVIVDFVSFLNESWALPLYYDQFDNFKQEMQNEVVRSETHQEDELGEVMESLAECLEGGVEVPEEARTSLYRAFDNASARRQLDKRVFDYLHQSEMYRSYP